MTLPNKMSRDKPMQVWSEATASLWQMILNHMQATGIKEFKQLAQLGINQSLRRHFVIYLEELFPIFEQPSVANGESLLKVQSQLQAYFKQSLEQALTQFNKEISKDSCQDLMAYMSLWFDCCEQSYQTVLFSQEFSKCYGEFVNQWLGVVGEQGSL